jgi:hypothetical protein
VADTVGAGSEDFGKDGRKANGGWEKGATGLRSGGQKSLAEVWGASKAGKKLPPEKDIVVTKTPTEADVVSQHADELLDQDVCTLTDHAHRCKGHRYCSCVVASSRTRAGNISTLSLCIHI